MVDQQGVSVVLSSHLIADVERVCDYVVVLVDSQVRIAGTIADLMALHQRPAGGAAERVSLEDVLLGYMSGAEPRP